MFNSPALSPPTPWFEAVGVENKGETGSDPPIPFGEVMKIRGVVKEEDCGCLPTPSPMGEELGGTALGTAGGGLRDPSEEWCPHCGTGRGERRLLD